MKDEGKVELLKSDQDSVYNLKARTLLFALEIIELVSTLPKSMVTSVIGKQVLRSGTSVGAQYREASRAKSNAEFISKLEGCLQELEETRYWLELLKSSDLLNQQQYIILDDEANQLIAIFITIVKKVKTKP